MEWYPLLPSSLSLPMVKIPLLSDLEEELSEEEESNPMVGRATRRLVTILLFAVGPFL
jgi:hypothetical protein